MKRCGLLPRKLRLTVESKALTLIYILRPVGDGLAGIALSTILRQSDFRKGNIIAFSEEIRRVLERDGVIR